MKSRLISGVVAVGVFIVIVAFSFVAPHAETLSGETLLIPKATIPAALIGTWRKGEVATVDFYNAQTGAWQNDAAEGMFLSIQADGEYRLGSVASVYLNGSEARLLLYQQGRIAIIDKQLVLQLTSGYTGVLENCAPARPAKSQSGLNDLAASVFAFEIVADKNVPYRPTLVLTSETGEKIALVVDGL